ncbi:hypothetical protein PHLGIDRAFT_114343 [Phlebiopsis gigantea 11061_1 CR5-6]|uniref:G-protein coupled receptors family 1 profile domain-containing protein n=1 Tax=Phlebiopsis gigantea (strain 11061_1 CR5-6) TaxID=745531 RepID=A0A0C3SDF4_PHLG1|nr:hypothetical protein PHLGIDRAFT_114343 [Phlebiopsis gigantea 11061_1 CR5-6]
MALLNTLFTLVTVGQASLLVLLVTLSFSKRIRRRNATMVNLLVVSVLSPIPLPLLYYGDQILNPAPPFDLCFTQAVLKYGTDAMFCVAAFCLIAEILLQTGIILWPFKYKTCIRLLIGFPYAIFLIFAMWAGVLGGTDRSAVRHKQNDYYCSLKFVAFGRGIYIVCVVMVSLSMALEVYAIIKSRRFWRGIPQSRQIKPTKQYSKSLYFRVLVFSVCQLFYFVVFGFDFFLQSVATHVIPIVFEAGMPLATFLIFASCPDVLAAWKFWKGRTEDLSPSEGAGARTVLVVVPVSDILSTTVSPMTDETPYPPPDLAVSSTVSPPPITDYLGVNIPDSSLGLFSNFEDT